MGGVLILFSMLIALFLWMDLTSSFTFILCVATLWLGLIGAYDDYLKMKFKNSKGLRGKKKFVLQVAFSVFFGLYLLWPSFTGMLSSKKVFPPPEAKQFVASHSDNKVQEVHLSTQEYATHYYLPFYKDPIFVLKGGLIILSLFFIIFVVTGSSNAVNLTDGLDGLASGCLIMTSFVLAIFAFVSNHLEMSRYLNILYIEGSGEIGIYLFALIGACLGFLWYNGYPAQVFMGDTGSIALGGILGVSAVLLRREVLLALAGGIFVAEAASVILQVLSYKYRSKKRIFLCSPLHHHYEFKGWPETKVVMRFWIVSLILAMIAVASLKFQ
jgi:phospho-N-acetylmuramoyl-pentapeptide-transferase